MPASMPAHPRWAVVPAAGALLGILAGGLQAPSQAAPTTSTPMVGSIAQRPSHLVPTYWFTAPSLRALVREVDARWPRRARWNDGGVGNHAHAHSYSDHNPVGHPNGPVNGTRGSVHAYDITTVGVDDSALLRAVVGDRRVWYVIYQGAIYSRTYGWAPRTYFGDRHSQHMHISLRAESQAVAVSVENDTSSWLGNSGSVSSASQGSGPYRMGASGSQVRTLQRLLIRAGYSIPAGATGYYGSQTKSAVARFQRAQGWRGSDADGFPGPATLRRLKASASSGSGSTVSQARRATSSGGKKSTTTKSSDGLPRSWPYRPGKRGQQVRDLQRALIRAGYRIPAGATGYFGPQTRTAVKRFQRAQGWRGSDADGIPGPSTLSRLKVAGTSAGSASTSGSRSGTVRSTAKKASSSPTYRTGISGTRVKQLQRALIRRGYSIPAGATGYFGPQTRKAVKRFQRAQGWRGPDADGIPGPGTLRALGLR